MALTKLLLTSKPFKNTLQFSRNVSSGKIYELRTYSIKPECMKPFVDLSLEKFHIRTQFSKLHGYWASEIGGINQVVHIWEYDNYLHRSKVRQTLAGNEDWISQYFSKGKRWFNILDFLCKLQHNFWVHSTTRFKVYFRGAVVLA